MFRSSIALLLLSTSAFAQTAGDYIFTRTKAGGFNPTFVTPQAGKVLGFDNSLNLVALTAQSGGEVAWADITGKPSTFTPNAHNQAWSTITDTPTTLADYGITDAATAAQGALASTALQPGAVIPWTDVSGKPTFGTMAQEIATDYLTIAAAAGYASLTGTYANPTWITELAWSKITNAPSFLTGNQAITLSGAVTGSGTTAITTTLEADQARGNLTGGTGTLNLSGFTLTLPSDVTRLGSSIDLGSEVEGSLPHTSVSGLGTLATQSGTLTDYALISTVAAGYQPLATVLTNTTAAFTNTLETKLTGIAAGAEVNVNADWNAGSGDAQILNKPTLGTMAAETATNYLTTATAASTYASLSGSYSDPAWITGLAWSKISGAPAFLTSAVTSVTGTGSVNGLTLTGTVTNTGNITLGGTLSGNAPSLTAGEATTAISLVTTSGTVSVIGAAAPTAGQVLTATSASTANWQTPSGTSGIGGTVGTVANAIPRASGTGGSTLTSSSITISDLGGLMTGGSVTHAGNNVAVSLGNDSLMFEWYDPDNYQSLSIQPNTLATSSWVLTLPSTPGTSGQMLSTDGSGVTSWANPPNGISISSTAISGGTSGRLLTSGSTVGEQTLASGVSTLLSTFSSANLRAALTDEVGTGAAYFVGGALGTPQSVTLTNATGLPTAGMLDASVTLAKMANLAQDQFIGRTTASTGVPQTATITAAARTVLDDTSVANMVNTLGGATSTGTGGLARATSPAFVTPTLGAAVATTPDAPDNSTRVATTAFVKTLVKFPGYIGGLGLANNSTDANNDIDVTQGAAVSDIGFELMSLTATLTKRLDASWTVGTGNGGLDTGSKANSTWYSVWLIQRTDTGVVDALFSTSPDDPFLPDPYNRKRRIGWVRTNASGNLLSFIQRGDYFFLSALAEDHEVTTLSTARTSYVVTAPPSSIALLQGRVFHSSTLRAVILTSPDLTDLAPTAGNATVVTGPSGGRSSYQVEMPVNAASQAAARSDGAATWLSITTRGWIDQR
jgi:hypothetical protein